MVYQILSSGSSVYDNRGFATPFNFELAIERFLVVPEGSWFVSGGIELQLQIFFSSTSIPDNLTDPITTRNGTDRFLNPTQKQVGYWAACNDSFVVNDDRIKYDKQAYSYSYPRIELSNTLNNLPKAMRLSRFSREGHAQTISEVSICGTTTGIVTPPPTPSVLNTDSRIGDGGICMRIVPGQTEYEEINRFEQLAPKELQIDTRELLAPDLITGVVYGGYRLECSYQFGYHQAASSAFVKPFNGIISGAAPFTPITYTCDNGQNQPFTPQQCTPGSRITTANVLNADGTYSYSLDCSGTSN